jgi:hypothetical protein
MQKFPSVPRFRQLRAEISLAFACVLLIGCHPSGSSRTPVLEITRAPLASPGGPQELDYIEGTATGATPGQQIVLYAHSGIWWIQPFSNQKFTKIQPDSTWKNSTHLGTEYAALLVEPGYNPIFKIETLPNVGNGVVAVVVAKGRPAAPIVTKVVHFSGYDWTVRNSGSDRGGEPNLYDADNVWTDDKGYLHLRMALHNGRWTCAEVSMNRSLGYGSYHFVVQDSTHLPPSGVLGLFTWDEMRSADFRSELDVELSRWGNLTGKNAQYVVQPFYVPENVSRFTVPPGVLTHVFRWEPGKASFKTMRGSEAGPGAKAVGEHVFSSGIPIPASETVHMDLYDFHHAKSASQQPAEVVIEKFEYLP